MLFRRSSPSTTLTVKTLAQDELRKEKARVPHAKKMSPIVKSQEMGIVDFIPGMKIVTSSKTPLFYRIGWATMLTILFVVCLYQITDRIGLFLRKDKVFQTTISVNDSVRLPAITICTKEVYGSMEIRREYVEDHGGDELPHQVDWRRLVGYKGRNVYQVWESYKTSSILNETQFPSAFLISPSQMKINRHTFPSFLGFCETLDLSENLIRYEYGNIIHFKITTTDFVKAFPGHRTHLKIRIHSPTEKVHHTIPREGVDVHYGMKIDVLISYERVIFSNTSQKPCVDDETFHSCEDICINQWLAEGHPCRLPYMKIDLPYCDTEESVREVHNATGDILYHPFKCTTCNRKCIQDAYGALVMPFATGLDHLEIRLFYEDNIFVTNQEIDAYNYLQCVSDVGGSLGLFLGFGLLHILQVIDKAFINLVRKLKCSNCS